MEQASNYDSIKELILQGYELVPEAYHQKFHTCEKESNKTYVEFSQTKEQLFDCWCAAEKIGKNHEKLRQFILTKELNQCIHSDIRSFINEQKAETLAAAAHLADNYSLTHKLSFVDKSNQSFAVKQRNSSFMPDNKRFSGPPRNSFKESFYKPANPPFFNSTFNNSHTKTPTFKRQYNNKHHRIHKRTHQ